jgi:hypothetical protein
MRRLMLIGAMLLVGSLGQTQGVSGTWPNPAWCPTCFVASHADSPSAGAVITANTVVWLWAGVCQNGASPSQIDATALANGVPYAVPVAWVTGGARPDVTAHLQSQGCHGGNVVMAVWFPAGFRDGTSGVSVRVYAEDIFAYHVFSVD